MLYTRKGDKGDTYAYGCNQRFSKSSELAEALGALDEINSFLGLIKIKAESSNLKIVVSSDTINRIGEIGDCSIAKIVEKAQQELFIIQANLAGADKKITDEKVKSTEAIIDTIEKELPPIKTFFVAGGTEISALLDYARTIARRAERRVVAVSEKSPVQPEILAYMNRLSSLLYALARFVNHSAGVRENPPTYQ